jgi:hypothetical protein
MGGSPIRRAAIALAVIGLVTPASAQAVSGWSPPAGIDPSVGALPPWRDAAERGHFNGPLIGLESVSCSSPAFCVTVGGAFEGKHERGYVLTFDGDAWSRPLRVQGQLQLISVSCVSSSFCAAIGNQITGTDTFAGYALTYDGHRWSKPTLLSSGLAEQEGRSSELEMISCSSSSFCAVTNKAGGLFRYNGRAWSEAISSYPDGGVVGLACPADDMCHAVVNLPSQDLSEEIVGGVKTVREIPFQEAFALTFNGGSWSAPSALAVTGPLSSLACPTTSFCMALGNSAKESPPEPGSTGFALTFDGSSWSAPQHFAPKALGVGPISCASPSLCVALEHEEAARTFNGSSWSTPAEIDAGGAFLGEIGLVAISCPSASFCIALNGQGRALYYPASAVRHPISEANARLHVSPTAAHPGERVRISGSISSMPGQLGCLVGDQVEMLLRATPGKHRTAAIPAMYARVADNGSFSAHLRIPARARGGNYKLGGRCNGRDLGTSTTLRVITPPRRQS